MNLQDWKNLKRNWYNTMYGSLEFFLNHPICAIPLFYRRFFYSLNKHNMFNKSSLKTPEGFELKSDMELLVYFQTFVAKNLYQKDLLNDLMYWVAPHIIDVGANVGLVTQWFKSFNKNTIFTCIEKSFDNVCRGLDINDTARITWYSKAASNFTDDDNLRIDDITKLPLFIFAIKIDTDGSNIKVLEGGLRTLNITKWLIIEIEPGIEEFMTTKLPQFKLVNKPSPDDLVYLNSDS